MQDISYNMDVNDIETLNGDFRIAERCSQQNAALMLDKSAVNIYNAQYGVGLGEVYPNLPYLSLIRIMSECQSQLYEDGAATAKLTAKVGDRGHYDIDVDVAYKGEQ